MYLATNQLENARTQVRSLRNCYWRYCPGENCSCALFCSSEQFLDTLETVLHRDVLSRNRKPLLNNLDVRVCSFQLFCRHLPTVGFYAPESL